MRDEQAMQPQKTGHADRSPTGKHPQARRLFPLSVGLFLIAGGIGVGAFGTKLMRPPSDDTSPSAAIVKMGQLVSLKLNYAEIHEFTQNHALGILWSQWQIPMGGTTIVLVARGDCSVATNLNEARFDNVDPTKHMLVMSLPSPQPFRPRINYESRDKGGSYFYAITSRGVQALIPNSADRTTAINHALSWAQEDIKRACSQRQVVESARENAEAVLRTTLQATGWKPTFVWR